MLCYELVSLIYEIGAFENYIENLAEQRLWKKLYLLALLVS